jgi:glycosyltransferase involved in cell wall biosynthesis
MRIGLISPPWVPVPPPAYGGIESVVHRLACGLVAAGHDVLLAASGESTCPVPRVAALPRAQGSRIGDTVVELRHLVRAYAAMDDVDLVHDHTVAGPLFRNRPQHLPVVTTNHGPFLSDLGELYQVMGPEVAVVAISHHQASTSDGVPIARVIHHGIDTAEVPPGKGTGGYACFLGRMHPHKGPREAILVARRAGIALRMAARMQEPEEREYFQYAVAPLLGADAVYVGELDEAGKYELLGGAVALVNPIQWPEPFGLVMLEALATGTPVVGTPSGAAPEIVDDGTTGYLRSDPEQLAAALTRAADLDRSACRTAVTERFSTDRMVRQHIGLYGEILEAARRHSRFRPFRRYSRATDYTRTGNDGARDAG